MEQFTISTHNGHRVSRQHNLRNRKVTDREGHIRKDGLHETWIDIDPKEAYKELFGEAISEYNQKMIASGHPDRQISDYYKKICNDKKKHSVYEMIISIGNKDHHPPRWLSKAIMRQFVETWEERNPSLKMIGAYYHADEAADLDSSAINGHVHIDYIPVAYNLTRGPAVQTALKRALVQMGIEPGVTMKETAQIIWEKKQNEYLESLCTKNHLEIVHPHIDKSKHLETKEYKQLMRIDDLEREEDQVIDRVNSLITEHNELVKDNAKLADNNLALAKRVLERRRNKDRGYHSR